MVSHPSPRGHRCCCVPMMVPCLGISTVHHTTTHQTELRVAQRLPSPRPRRFWLEYASRWAVHLQLKHRRPAWDKWTSRQPASPKLRLQKAAFHWDRRPSSVWNRVGTRQDGPFSAWSRAALNCSSCLCPCSRACLARRVGPPFLCARGRADIRYFVRAASLAEVLGPRKVFHDPQ